MEPSQIAVVLGTFLLRQLSLVRFIRQLVDSSLRFRIGPNGDDLVRRLRREAFG